jgi:hypothetical protein
MNNELKILEPNKTVIFQSPIGDNNITLVRTGVINDENSFFHAVLLSYSKDYFFMNLENRIKLVNKFKNNIFNKKTFLNDKKNFLTYQDKTKVVFLNFYTYLEKGITDDRIVQKVIIKKTKNEIVGLIPEIINLEDLNKILDNNTCLTITEYELNVVSNIENYLISLDILKQVDKEKFEFINKNIIDIIHNFFDEIKNNLFNHYIKNLKNTIDINLVSNYIKTNIYFIDSLNRLPFIFNNDQPFNYDKCIIILKREDNYYENIGFLLPESKIQREFKNKDNVIIKIQNLLNNKNIEPKRNLKEKPYKKIVSKQKSYTSNDSEIDE